jgi:hypothetical protein
MWWKVSRATSTDVTFHALDLWSISIGGLAAARVCHDHFERVIIVEPEGWLATAEGWDPNNSSHKNNRSRIVQYHSIQGALV